MTDNTPRTSPAQHEKAWTQALDCVLDHVYDNLTLDNQDPEDYDTPAVTAWLHQIEDLLLLDDPEYSHIHTLPAEFPAFAAEDLREMKRQARTLLAA